MNRRTTDDSNQPADGRRWPFAAAGRPVLSAPVGPPQSPAEARFRRRRNIAVLVAIALLPLIAGIGSGGSSRRAAARPVPGRGFFGVTPAVSPAAAAAAIGGITPAQSAAIDRALLYTSYIASGSGRHRDIALTFDDGPGPFTSQILAILEHEHAPATFFQVGRSIRDYTSVAQDEVRLGFPIGDHTQNHPLLGSLSPADQRLEVVGAANAIQDYGATYPRLFRPPYGSFDTATLSLLRAQRMLMVLWSIDTKDFSQPGASQISYTALSGAKPGAIVLMHDAGGQRAQTVAALPGIIRSLRRRRFRLVTVPQLVLDDPPPEGQPIPHNLSGR